MEQQINVSLKTVSEIRHLGPVVILNLLRVYVLFKVGPQTPNQTTGMQREAEAVDECYPIY